MLFRSLFAASGSLCHRLLGSPVASLVSQGRPLGSLFLTGEGEPSARSPFSELRHVLQHAGERLGGDERLASALLNEAESQARDNTASLRDACVRH